MDLQSKCLKAHLTVQQIKEAIGIEQFLNSLPMKKRAWVSDKKLTTCVQAELMADEYELARNQNQESLDKPADFPHEDNYLELLGNGAATVEHLATSRVTTVNC